jgi:hypothetical protein
MRKLALIIIGFTMFLNFASGLIYLAVPAFNEYSEISNGLNYYDASLTDEFTSTMKDEVKPSGGVIEDKGGSIWRVFDMINIGIIAKFQLVIEKFLFGFVDFLALIFSGMLAADVYTFIFGRVGLLRICVVIIYIIALVGLWTGRDITR